MKRNIVDLRPDGNIVLDADMVFAISFYHENEVCDEWVIRIFSKEAPNGLHIHCKTKEKAEKLFKKISDGMIQ